MSAFLSVDLLTEFAAFCLTDFIDWRYIHSWFVFSTQLVNCCPHGRSNYMVLVYCCPSTVLYLLSDLLPPPHPSQCTVQYTDCVWLWEGGGGGVLKCTVDHILQEFYTRFLTRFRTYKIASQPQTKMTSKDDIKGLVSLKFLRPCSPPLPCPGGWQMLMYGHFYPAMCHTKTNLAQEMGRTFIYCIQGRVVYVRDRTFVYGPKTLFVCSWDSGKDRISLVRVCLKDTFVFSQGLFLPKGRFVHLTKRYPRTFRASVN